MQPDSTQDYTSASADRPAPNILKRRICLLSVVIGLILGLPLGAVIGARYLYWNPLVHLLGAPLPPYENNFKANNPGHLIAIGMSKQEVIEKLELEQVMVLPGGIGKERWHQVIDDGAGKIPKPDGLAEIWLVPWRKTGLSNFTAICFDQSQKVILFHGSDRILGFPVKPYGYANGGWTKTH